MYELPPLSPEQQEAYDLIQRGENIFISGPAGVGKSVILQTLKREWPWLPITGTTGLAAFNVGGVTLHSWAGLGILTDSAETITAHILRKNPKAKKNIQRTQALAIDELSAFSADNLDKINRVFQLIRSNRKPFGGIQMITFGDYCQIPPVPEKGTEAKMAFEAECWTEFHTRVLNRIFRQNDNRFIGMLNKIRVGDIDEDVLQLFRERSKPDPDEERIPPIIVHTHNEAVDQINHNRLEKLAGTVATLRAIDCGTESLKANLAKHATVPTELLLKIGARVMLGANLDAKTGLVNGATGFVTGFTEQNSKLLPFVQFDDGPHKLILPELWEIKDGETIIGSRMQIPLRLAWAITAHKIQGQTLSKIKVFLHKTFEYGQAYVALSRVKSIDGLFIAEGGTQSIKTNPKAIEFYQKERQKRWLERMAAEGIADAHTELQKLQC